jgi:hypothetical protein
VEKNPKHMREIERGKEMEREQGGKEILEGILCLRERGSWVYIEGKGGGL